MAEIVSAQKLSLLTREKPEEKNVDEIINKVEKMLGIEYAQNQKKALEKVANNKVCIITGGPGTGKTTLVKGIISMFEMQAQTVSLCAPTGRAAKRLTGTFRQRGKNNTSSAGSCAGFKKGIEISAWAGKSH